MSSRSNYSILIVDDEPRILDLYQAFLESEYDVVTAASGSDAIQQMGPHIDACLIDRRMPGMSGGDLVERLRNAGYDVPIGIITAVTPDFDVLDMSFDDYLIKPITYEELTDLVEFLILKQQYDDVLREYFSLASKISSLRSAKSADALDSNEEYRDAFDRLHQIKQDARHCLDAADDAGLLEELFRASFLQSPKTSLDEPGD